MISSNNFDRQWTEIGDDVLAAVARVGASGWYILGKEVGGFEEALAKWCRQPRAIGVASGLDALAIALRSLGLQPGDRVLTTPLSAFATTMAILQSGGIPVFVDVDERGQLDLNRCRQVLTTRPDIRWILPVHLYGMSSSLQALADLKQDFSLMVIEDCAQAIGCISNGQMVGAVGHAAAFSFYPTKNLGALGDAGAIVTNDESLADACSRARNYGQSRQYLHDSYGVNSRLDELHAAILKTAMLPNLARWTERRRAIAGRYLAGISNPAIRLLAPQPECHPVWHLFPILVAPVNRESLQSHLRERGIQSGVHYPTAIPHQPYLVNCACFEVIGSIDRAVGYCHSEISLPINPFLTDAEVDVIVEACNQWKP